LRIRYAIDHSPFNSFLETPKTMQQLITTNKISTKLKQTS